MYWVLGSTFMFYKEFQILSNIGKSGIEQYHKWYYDPTVKKGSDRKQNVVVFIAILLWNEGNSTTTHTNCASTGIFFNDCS